MTTSAKVISRAKGCLLGQLAGDALGSLVEFQSPEQIRSTYPNGVRTMHNGGTWNTIAGQATDDSEMALALARTLIQDGAYCRTRVRAAYQAWFDSDPFDCGRTVADGLKGRPNRDSQANGALMRISPLALLCMRFDASQIDAWAMQDAQITHPHPICVDVNRLFVGLLTDAIQTGAAPRQLFERMLQRARVEQMSDTVNRTIEAAASAKPADYTQHQGWVLIAWQNALWQLLHAPSLEAGVVDTIMQGGDTDTNAAICGALLAAVYGAEAIPAQWREALSNCQPEAGRAQVYQPRPRIYWPCDAEELAIQLVSAPE